MTETVLTFLNIGQILRYFSINEVSVACLIIFVITLVLYWKVGKKKYKLPPGPSGFQSLGQEPYKELHKLKKLYGNVFSLYIGWKYTVILGDFEAVKEVYAQTTEKSVGFDILPDALGFSGENGQEWAEQRKFTVKLMRDLGVGKESWESMVQVEVDDLINLVYSFNGEPTNIIKNLTSSVSNISSSFILGRQLPSDHPDRIFLDSVMGEIIQILGQTPSGYLLPTLQDVAMKFGMGNMYKRLKKFNDFFRRETEKLKESYKSGGNASFITDYLKEMENHKNKSGHYFTETNLYGNIQGLFLGSIETTRTAIYWLLLIIANFPDVQKKIHLELDSVLDEKEQIRWSTRNKVAFTFATIMEGQRWKTLAPLNSPRITKQDIKVKNYDIPMGTPIVANIWGIHHDTKYWKEPEKFDPGRFLTGNGKEVMTRPDSYIPFSYGKRNCPGEAIALMEILLYFTAFMQNFTVLPPKGVKVNLNGIQGITYQAHPQDLCFVPRKRKNSKNIDDKKC